MVNLFTALRPKIFIIAEKLIMISMPTVKNPPWKNIYINIYEYIYSLINIYIYFFKLFLMYYLDIFRSFLTSLHGNFKCHKEDMQRKMECYLQTSECRRRFILKHFSPGTKFDEVDPESCCDNCIKR